jgi:hypothetical protein
MFERYQGRIPNPPSPKVHLRAEHSMHDVEYVLLGSLAGSLATSDNEIIEDYSVIRRGGLLIRVDGTTTRAR